MSHIKYANWKNAKWATVFFLATAGVLFCVVAQSTPEIASRKVLLGFPVALCAIGCILLVRIISEEESGKFSHTKTVQHLFLVIYVCGGLLAMAAMPLGSGYDEGEHFMRAYQVLQGAETIRSPEGTTKGTDSLGAMLADNSRPTVFDVYQPDITFPVLIDSMDADHVDSSAQQYYGFFNTVLYTPLTYAPYYPGMIAVGLSSSNSLAIAYGGRFSAWLIFGIILFFAIGRFPYGKEVAALVCLLPSTIMFCVCWSGDGLVFVASLFLLAEVLRARASLKRLSWLNIVGCWVLVLLVGLCKMAYMPICLLILLIPKRCYKTRASYAINVLGCAAVGLTLSLLWMYSATALESGVSYVNNANSGEQLRFVLANVPFFVSACVLTVLDSTLPWLAGLVGSSVVQHSALLGLSSAIVGIVFIVVATLDAKHRRGQIDICAKVSLTIIVFLVCGLIFAGEYITFTSVGASRVEGVQARYFIPLLMPAIMALRPSRRVDSAESPEPAEPALDFRVLWELELCALVVEFSVVMVSVW